MSVVPSGSPKTVVLADVVDTAHLARYTMGDERLEHELLRMFRAQLDELTGTLEAATDERQWRQAAHALKGAARAIGAFPLAEAAAAAEAAGPVGGREMLSEIARQAEAFRLAFSHWEKELHRYSA